MTNCTKLSVFFGSLSLLERLASFCLLIWYLTVRNEWAEVAFVFIILPVVIENTFFMACTDTKDLGYCAKFVISLGFLPQVLIAQGAVDVAMKVQMIEVFFGAAPQLFLQLYLLGNQGVYSVLSIIAIFIQAIFVCYGILYFLFNVVTANDSVAQKSSVPRKKSFVAFFLPWTLLFLFCCASLPFFASIDAWHTLSPHMAVVIYFLFHLGCVAFLFSRKNAGYMFLNVLLGVLFAFTSLSFAAFWLVIWAQRLDPWKRGLPGVPNFIWPNTSSYFARWQELPFKEYQLREYRNSHSFNHFWNYISPRLFILKCDELADKFLGYMCIQPPEGQSPGLFGCFIAANFILLFYHCILTIVWANIFPSKKEEDANENEGIHVPSPPTAAQWVPPTAPTAAQWVPPTAPYPPISPHPHVSPYAPYVPNSPMPMPMPMPMDEHRGSTATSQIDDAKPNDAFLSPSAPPFVSGDEIDALPPPPSYDEALNLRVRYN